MKGKRRRIGFRATQVDQERRGFTGQKREFLSLRILLVLAFRVEPINMPRWKDEYSRARREDAQICV